MKDNRSVEIHRRRAEIDAELKDIRACKVTLGTDPATREGELLEALDALEYEIGGGG